MKLNDLTSRKFGRLTVVKRVANRNAITYWQCICDCGVVKDIRSTHLTMHKTLSCGCFKRERAYIS